MLATDHRPGAPTAGFCWSCGVPDARHDSCDACGNSVGPKAAHRSDLIGASASVRLKLRNRVGLVVAETARSALLAFPDATVTETPRDKLSGVIPAGTASRSSAWTLVEASRTVRPDDRRKFDELLSSFVLTLTDRSVDEARVFALDALDADCPGWLDKLHLTTTERDFLFASYHAHHGNTALALDRLIRLPEDRYPTKDVAFLRCLGAIHSGPATQEKVARQLMPFVDRPIASVVLHLIGRGDNPNDEKWIRAAQIALTSAPEGNASFSLAAAQEFLHAITNDTSLPKATWELGAEVRRLALARVARGGGLPPEIALHDLHDAPTALVDDAIELGVLSIAPGERDHPAAKYVLARTDPEVLEQKALEELEHESEIARRAFLRGDLDALSSLPSASSERFRVLAALRAGDHERALHDLEAFSGQDRDKVESISASLASGSIQEASAEVLTDGTTWPLLAVLLPEDTSALNKLAEGRPALRGIVAWRALSGALSRLWEWDPEGAVVEAKRCLQVAKDEQTRDEALNLIACAEWLIGDDADAIAALSSALEGSYTEGLQVNMGIVAASLEPQLAGAHLGRLAMEAPTIALRVSAAERALQLWFADPDPWQTQEDEHSLPIELRDALRSLVRNDIPEESFVRFVRTMSAWDDEWLARPDLLNGTAFEGSDVASVYQAKARDFEAFVQELAAVVAREDTPTWATDERDRLVGSAIAALNPEKADPMAASFGLVLIDGGLPMEAGVYVDLVSFSIAAVCDNIDTTEAEPKERFLDLVMQSRGRIPEVPSEQQERSSSLLDFAISRVVGSIAAARAHQYDQVVDHYNSLTAQLYGVPHQQINRAALRSATQPAMDFLTDTARVLERLIANAPDPDYKGRLIGFRDQVRDLVTSFRSMRGS